MNLKEMRESRGYTRKQLAEITGINLRSLQDYEQGHKDITHAKADTLYRLSIALGCSMESLFDECLVEYEQNEKNKMRGRLERYAIAANLSEKQIEKCDIYCRKYDIHGRFLFGGELCNIVFLYHQQLVRLPFIAEFNYETLPWLIELAIMKIESYVEDELFREKCENLMGEQWSEWE